MSKPYILADSNLIIYAINSSSPKHINAQIFLQKNMKKIVLAHQNITESLRVLTHSKYSEPMKVFEAFDSVERISKNSKLISPNRTTFYLFAELLKKYKPEQNRIFDIYLVATALSNDVHIIATDNTKDFLGISEIKTENPFNHL